MTRSTRFAAWTSSSSPRPGPTKNRGNCLPDSACRSPNRETGVSAKHGENVDDRQAKAQTEVQGAGLHALRTLRPSPRGAAEIPDLQNLFPGTGVQGPNPRREKSQLVIIPIREGGTSKW